jgi:hypothetical protein
MIQLLHFRRVEAGPACAGPQLAAAVMVVVLAGCAGGPIMPRTSPPVAAPALRSAATAELRALAPHLAGGKHAVFSAYNRKSKVKWAGGALRAVDLSGVGWDEQRSVTLISPRHVIMAAHYPRRVGAMVVLHDQEGERHERFVIRIEAGGRDFAVGLLNRPVPVTHYRVLAPRPDYDALLRGVPVLVTNCRRYVMVHQVAGVGGGVIRFGPTDLPGVAGKLIVGDSGNPSFLLVNGEPVLVETHTTGGFGSGPFLSDPANFAEINRLMRALGGGEQLEVVGVR